MNLKNIIPWKKEDTAVSRPSPTEAPIDLFQKRMNELFEDFFSGSPNLWKGFHGAIYPAVEVSETGKEIRLTAELPGIDKEDLEVSITKDAVTIQGEKKEEKSEEKGELRHSECSYGYFQRTIAMPPGVDPDKAEATFRRNVLKVTVPKRPGARSEKRRIEVGQ